MPEYDNKQHLKTYLQAQGANLVGVTSPVLPARYTDRFNAWIDDGHHADMQYLKNRIDQAITAESILPGVKSVIVLGFNYYFDETPTPTEPSGIISKYACFRDYHKVIGKVLKNTVKHINSNFNTDARAFVDTSPLPERAYAEQAGLGYVGKSGMLITRDYGTWVFLAIILTTLDIPKDQPAVYNFCGSCNRCIDACPTQALPGDGTLDSRKCLSYQTIENRGEIPEELHNGCGTHLFGCDDCQTVCPHNSRQNTGQRLEDFQNLRFPTTAFPLETCSEIQSNDDFLKHFAGTPVTRAKSDGFKRNARIVKKNLNLKK